MKKVSFVTNRVFHQNIIFDKKQTKFGIGSFEKYYRLLDEFKNFGYIIATDDIHTPKESDLVLYFDMPKKLPKKDDVSKSYLLALESSIIKSENFDKQKHRYFNKIFTWSDDLVDNEKYIKINYAFDLPTKIYKKTSREKLCCLIVSNKSSNFKNELYSEREKLVRWFEKNYIEDFSLYGFGWNRFRFSGSMPIRALNRVPYLPEIVNMLFGKKFASYKGMVRDKSETMKKYRFAIAYENVKGENGYITEKIFDAMMAGCVPVYLGAKNILDYIPQECFIDRREFATHEDLYSYMKSMSDDRYGLYLDNIEVYLRSEKARVFSCKYFAETIVNKTICND